MLKTSVALAVLGTTLLLAQLSTASTITDTFTNAANWGAPVQSGGNMSVGSGRMNYTSASTLNTTGGAAIARNTPTLSTTNDWSLQVDVHLDPFTLTTEGQFSDVFLGFGKTGDWMNTHVTFEFGRGRWGSHNGYYIQDGVRINGGDAPTLFSAWNLNLTASESALRMDYSAATHTITYYFDADGATGGYNWVAQGSANLASGTYNLNLSATDTFTILLTGSSGYQNVAAGQAYLSNLVITMNQSPIVTTGAATNITTTSAILNGTVNPNGLPTTAQFEYGLTTNYGNTANIILFHSNGVSAQAISATLDDLQPTTTYHYRFTGFSSGGVALGSDASFVTGTETVTNIWLQRSAGPGMIKTSGGGVLLWTNSNAISVVSENMKADSENNVIVMGANNGNTLTIKYSSAGVPLWTNVITGWYQANSMTIDSSDNVIVTGSLPVDANSTDGVTVKYSSAGVSLWTNRFRIPGYVANVGYRVETDGGNNVIVVGRIDPDNRSLRTDIATIKYSSAGVSLWTNIYNGPMNLYDSPVALAVDGSDDVIVLGSAQMVTGAAGYSSAVTIKYSSSGVLAWSNKDISGSYHSFPTALAVDHNNNIIAVGTYFKTIKYSSGGGLLWENYPTPDFSNPDQEAVDVAVDSNNNVIVTGSRGNNSFYYYTILTIKYSSAGTNMWTEIYDDNGGSGAFARAVAIDNHNNVIVAGVAQGDFITIKYFTDGPLPFPFTYSTTNNAITITGYTGGGGAVTIPSMIKGLPVTSISNGAFAENASLTSITFPASVTNIGEEAFASCASLTNITFGATLASIGGWAFFGSGLINVTIPASVTNIGDAAFAGCPGMTAITVETNNPAYASVDGVLFNKSQTTLVQYPGGKSGSYTTSNSVTNIADYAFADCILLTDLTISDSVLNIGRAAFIRCYELTSVTIGQGVTNIGDEAFSYDTSLTAIYFRSNAPCITTDLFALFSPATVFYLPTTTGWDITFGGCPTALWKPLLQTSGASFGVQTNKLGFNISWASGQTVVVEAATNLAYPAWSPVSTNTLTSGTSYFSDPKWTNYPGRFYRLRSP